MQEDKSEYLNMAIEGCYGPDYPVNLYLKGGFKIENVVIPLINLEDKNPDEGYLEIQFEGKTAVVFIEDIVMIEDL